MSEAGAEGERGRDACAFVMRLRKGLLGTVGARGRAARRAQRRAKLGSARRDIETGRRASEGEKRREIIKKENNGRLELERSFLSKYQTFIHSWRSEGYFELGVFLSI